MTSLDKLKQKIKVSKEKWRQLESVQERNRLLKRIAGKITYNREANKMPLPRRHYMQAVDALDIGLSLKKPEKIFLFQQLSIYRRVFDAKRGDVFHFPDKKGVNEANIIVDNVELRLIDENASYNCYPPKKR